MSSASSCSTTANLKDSLLPPVNQNKYNSQSSDIICIVCCYRQTGNENEETDWLTGTFSKFCQDVATKSNVQEISDAVTITLTPQQMLLGMQTNSDNVTTPPVLSVCWDCKEMINQVMEQKKKTANVELQVLSLQLRLITALRQLQLEMDEYNAKYNKIENVVRCSDQIVLEEHFKRNNDGGLGSSVFQLRNGVINASDELRSFQDDLSMKVDCNSCNISTVNPLDYAVVKVEVNEDDFDEHLLTQDEFYTAEDIPEFLNNLDKYTQTTEYFPPTEDQKSSGLYKRTRAKRNLKGKKPQVAPSFGCHLCKERFSSKATLESHHVKKHGAPKPKCPKCKKEFMNSFCLKAHLENHHHDAVKFYECDRCPAVFATSGKLNFHMESHRSRVLNIFGGE